MPLVTDAIHHIFHSLSPRLPPILNSTTPSDITSTLQDVADFTRIRPLRHAAVLALNIHENVQTIDHECDLYLQLADDCCQAVNCVLLIPSIPPYTTSSLPPSLADNVNTLLRILQDVHDFVRSQLCRLWEDRQITQSRDVTIVEQYQHNLQHLSRIFAGQLLCASRVEPQILPEGPALPRAMRYHPPMVFIPTLPTANTISTVGDTSLAFPLPFSYIPDFAPILSKLIYVARGIYMLLLFFMPLLYSSRILGILSEANLDQQMRVSTAQPENDRATIHLEISMNWWDSFSRTLVEEWAALRILAGLILAAIFAMFQIPSIRGNQTITAAALFLFVSVIYGSVLVIYVNGWRGTSSALMWIQEVREPFTIGFLWNIWILLALPAIWATWGVLFFFFSMMMIWISHEGDDDSDVRNLIPPIPSEPTISSRFTVTHPWFIPLFAIAMVYLALMVHTLWRLSGHPRTTDSSTAVV